MGSFRHVVDVPLPPEDVVDTKEELNAYYRDCDQWADEHEPPSEDEL